MVRRIIYIHIGQGVSFFLEDTLLDAYSIKKIHTLNAKKENFAGMLASGSVVLIYRYTVNGNYDANQ